jgi:hypothetical protein
MVSTLGSIGVFGVVHGFPYDLDVRDAAFDQSNLVSDFIEVLFLPGRKVVENDHTVAAADKFIHRVRTDKAGAARHDVAHSGNPPRSAAAERPTIHFANGWLPPPRARKDERLAFWYADGSRRAGRRGRMISSSEKILYDGRGTHQDLIRGSVTQKA